MRAALRHRLQQQGLGPVFRLRDLSLDFMAHRVTIGDADMNLSKREFELAVAAGRACGQGDDPTVRELRSKLGDDPASPRFIETEPGVGYRLKAD